VCLILFAYQAHPRYKLILAANRDEFYDRPTGLAGFWKDAPHVFAGRDLKVGGTWLGISKTGRIAAVTNYREQRTIVQGAPSRGMLVGTYLRGALKAEFYLQGVMRDASQYPGFNLITGDQDALWYYSNRNGNAPRRLEPGIYGLSNHVLDTPWPKVTLGKQRLKGILSEPAFSTDQVFDLLARKEKANDGDLPDSGVGIEIERMLSPIFIRSEKYGTRSSTVLLIDEENNVRFTERTFYPGVSGAKESAVSFSINDERYVSS
jgi:uncharacterized protein with NRDE domain